MSPREAAIAVSYWRSWKTTEVVDEDSKPVPQSTAHGVLGRLARKLSEHPDPELREVGKGLTAILGPGAKRFRISRRSL